MTEEFVTPEFIDNSDPDTIQSRMMNNLPVDISDMPADFPYDFTMPTAIEISRKVRQMSNLLNLRRLRKQLYQSRERLTYLLRLFSQELLIM